MEGRLGYKKKEFLAAVDDFSISLDLDLARLDPPVLDSVKSGRAQKFEVCVELLWKTLKVFLSEIHGLDQNSPKSVIKTFYSMESLDAADYEAVLEMVDDRNLLSHIYKKEQFEEIYLRIVTRLPLFRKVLALLENPDRE